MKQQLIVLFGPPASGKSTWARKWVEENPNKRIRVNRDELRRMMGHYWIPQREKLITKIEYECVYNALDMEYSVCIDATNLNKKYYRWPTHLEVWSRSIHFPEVELVENKSFLEVSIEECIIRDSLRSENEKVGQEVIRRFAKYIKE